MVFMKVGCVATESKRSQTRLQIKMAREETRTRLVEVENEMTQMAAMMAEMKAFIIAAKGFYPTISNPVQELQIPLKYLLKSQ